MWVWYREDVAIPLLACLAMAGAARLILPEPASPAVMLTALLVVSTLTLAVALAATPRMREMIVRWFSHPEPISGQQA
jgi:hypothetical protein